jgi:hypothetical protein
MEAERGTEEARRHEAVASRHDELAEHWEALGDPQRASLERRNAELERMAAQLERDRAALTEDREARPAGRGRDEPRPPVRSESEILSAVEILRGTTYDFRVEATIDVVNLFGPEVLVAALERLDAEIKPGPRSDGPARRFSSPRPR